MPDHDQFVDGFPYCKVLRDDQDTRTLPRHCKAPEMFWHASAVMRHQQAALARSSRKNIRVFHA